MAIRSIQVGENVYDLEDKRLSYLSKAEYEALSEKDDETIYVVEGTGPYGGLHIAPGPLYYNGTSYSIKDNWNYSSYDSSYGETSGSSYFNFIQLGNLFKKASFSKTDGDIENILNPLDG